MSTSGNEPSPQHEMSMIETLQSLIVAFVLAMAFRGFVLEGFVIPTGSMAPTLMGQHALWHSPQTGSTFRFDVNQIVEAYRDAGNDPGRRNEIASMRRPLEDPMQRRDNQLTVRSAAELAQRGRMGDRILVLKSIYPFWEPKRFDIVVFKTPTEPVGPSENYIKRLIGLPGEKILLADGDVFAGPVADADRLDDYRVQRKPEHVQRAVWQPIYHSDYVVAEPSVASQRTPADYTPWLGEGWSVLNQRSYRCDTNAATELSWNHRFRPIDDWTTYDMLGYPRFATYPVSDLRVAAAVVPETDALSMRLELEARSQIFEFIIASGQATLRMRAASRTDGEWEKTSGPVKLKPLKPGRATNVEFWHVDQAMSLYVDGTLIASLEYDWTPDLRLGNAAGLTFEEYQHQRGRAPFKFPQLRWHFEGSPLTLHRVRLDRDLYYQPTTNIDQSVAGRWDDPAQLASDQFFMLGDNSPASKDSRLWGYPHPLVAAQIDESPWIVNRKLLLGKAWVVYFPAPYPIKDGGVSVVPDFGRLRFIR